ncbi:MAG TPA: hypothetical protein VJY43_01770 [Methanocorpusculum sp.]|nr:hypothetical protein [Methanocorpusculum sp.]
MQSVLLLDLQDVVRNIVSFYYYHHPPYNYTRDYAFVRDEISIPLFYD